MSYQRRYEIKPVVSAERALSRRTKDFAERSAVINLERLSRKNDERFLKVA